LLNPFVHPVVAWQQLSHALVSYGPPGLFALAILDSAGVPIVGGVDVLLVAVASATPANAYPAALCALAGSLCGSLLLFFLARKGGEVFLARQISSGLGKRLHNWFQRYGLVTVFVPALSPVPLPMKIPVFCAGALQVRTEYFLLIVLIARAIRYFGLAFLAREYGQQTFTYLTRHGWQVGLAALGIAILTMLALRLFQRREVALGYPQ
jgi:membrane protein YqaA with SNARE-associated domain